jgi:hypothetical protein
MVFLSTVEVITHESKTQKKRSRNSDARWKPAAVILDIEEYRALLEGVEDMEDLKMLRKMRKRPVKFRKLAEFLRDSDRGV